VPLYPAFDYKPHCGNAGPEGTCIDIAKGVVYKL
jgi:hypothetical protein